MSQDFSCPLSAQKEFHALDDGSTDPKVWHMPQVSVCVHCKASVHADQAMSAPNPI